MPAATSPEGISAARVLAILRAQSGITPAVTGLAAARVTRYIKAFVPDDEFYEGLRTTGPWAHVKGVVIRENEQQGFYSYDIPIEVWYGLTRGADNDGITIEDTNYAIRAALNAAANWSPAVASVGPQPYAISNETMEQDAENMHGEFVRYVITPHFYGALAGN